VKNLRFKSTNHRGTRGRHLYTELVGVSLTRTSYRPRTMRGQMALQPAGLAAKLTGPAARRGSRQSKAATARPIIRNQWPTATVLHTNHRCTVQTRVYVVMSGDDLCLVGPNGVINW
jgi:hypothetical protein